MKTPKGLILTLQGKTLKGKNRVRENGLDWVVLETSNDGATVLIAPLDPDSCTGINKDRMRWVNRENDPDFDITGWC